MTDRAKAMPDYLGFFLPIIAMSVAIWFFVR